MSSPNDFDCLPNGAQLICEKDGGLTPSKTLVDLLVAARAAYDWPANTGAQKCQQTILDLEGDVAGRLKAKPFTVASAHSVVLQVSHWAGNGALAHRQIMRTTQSERNRMRLALLLLRRGVLVPSALAMLAALPGLGLIVASKIYRFCVPDRGAAVDRHASYFFNSLDVVYSTKHRDKATDFSREWANAKHVGSRLAAYSMPSRARNTLEYAGVYLPLLAGIAEVLNFNGVHYRCAATLKAHKWRAADVEMAAYYWWASNGAR